MLYPTEVFLAILGLPTEDGRVLLPLVEGYVPAVLRRCRGGDRHVRRGVAAYYKAAIDERLAEPGPSTDFITYLLQAEPDGAPLRHEDVQMLCFTIMLAGLDTARSGWGTSSTTSRPMNPTVGRSSTNRS